MSNLVIANRMALVLVALAVISTLMMYTSVANCGIARILFGFNVVVAFFSFLLVLVGLIQTLVSKQIKRMPGVLCFIGVLLLLGVIAPFNLMLGIGLGHCYG